MSAIDKLFVYGTLRRGFDLNPLLSQSGARFMAKGRIRARLFDLGDYPGAVPAITASDFVEGELYRLTSPSRQLKILDEVEEFDPRHPKTSLFRRRLVNAKLEDSSECRAWAYFLNRGIRNAKRVPRGDYALAREVVSSSHAQR
jgi:pyruvate carboxylase